MTSDPIIDIILTCHKTHNMQQLLINFDLSPEAHQCFTQIDEKIEEIGSNSGHIHVRYYLQFFSGQLPKIADSPLQ